MTQAQRNARHASNKNEFALSAPNSQQLDYAIILVPITLHNYANLSDLSLSLTQLENNMQIFQISTTIA